MPFYEYECSSCKYYTEVLQKLSDVPLRKCPSCGKNTFTKLVSAPVFRLKGSGWYETDFKGDKDKQRNIAGDESKPADDKKDTAKATEPAKAEPAKAEPAKAETPKPAVETPAAASKPAARSRRGALPARGKAAPANAKKKKARR